MTRSELIRQLSRRFKSLKIGDVQECVDQLLQAMSNRLAAKERIELRGFGTFSVHERTGRRGRNPKTGESLLVPSKWVPHFKPGKELRETVMSAGERGSSQNPREPG